MNSKEAYSLLEELWDIYYDNENDNKWEAVGLAIKQFGRELEAAQTRIKTLEAELAEVKAENEAWNDTDCNTCSIKNWTACEFICKSKASLTKEVSELYYSIYTDSMYLREVAESEGLNFELLKQSKYVWRMFEIQRKWARRWKRSAVAKENKICEFSLVQAVHSMALVRNKARIAALENACRSCEACAYYHEDRSTHLACKICATTEPKYGCWKLDKERFAKKESAENDNATKTKIQGV